MVKIFSNKILSLLLILALFALLFNTLGLNKDTNNLEYKGAVLAHIHLVESGYGSKISQTMHKHLSSVGYDSIQLNTFAYMKDSKQNYVVFDNDPTLSDKYLIKEIRNLKGNGFKVMLKPHIWIGGLTFDPDNWRNKIDFQNIEDRGKWFSSYTNFILSQARIAEQENVEIFVIGTELVELTKHDNDWKDLINKVREIYSGKLTYASEGLNSEKIRFWSELDYIGIDAYFPIANKKNTTIKELAEGWNIYEKRIALLSNKFQKKVIFTEIGFKSVEGSAINPWEWKSNAKVSFSEQAKAFESTFKVFKYKDYLAGMFIWKYFTDMDSYEKSNVEKGFTPYKKKSETVISDYFNLIAK